MKDIAKLLREELEKKIAFDKGGFLPDNFLEGRID
jgi:hypothetical protein